MKTLVVAVACAGVLALSGVARAAQISSPGIFGIEFQSLAECVVFNGGATPLAVKVQILSRSGSAMRTEHCDGSLGPGQFCVAVAGTSQGLPIGDGFPVSCIATAASTANLRGALTIHDRVVNEWGTLDFRPVRSAPLQ
jgi:hypothetical protein